MSFAIIAAGLLALALLPQAALACGEKPIEFVDSAEGASMEKSACTKSYFPSNGESFLAERSMVKVTDHQAKHILQDYLLSNYREGAAVTMEGTEIPGHENHNHGHGNPQLSHGHYTWTFNVRVPGMYEGKSFPMYVDMETGEVYGVGCGFGAGSVVYSPDLSEYPDSDMSDWDWHARGNTRERTIRAGETDIFKSFGAFLLGIFGLA